MSLSQSRSHVSQSSWGCLHFLCSWSSLSRPWRWRWRRRWRWRWQRRWQQRLTVPSLALILAPLHHRAGPEPRAPELLSRKQPSSPSSGVLDLTCGSSMLCNTLAENDLIGHTLNDLLSKVWETKAMHLNYLQPLSFVYKASVAHTFWTYILISSHANVHF